MEGDKGSADPFDFQVDFDKVQKRRERAAAAKEAAKSPEEQAILPQMDVVPDASEVVSPPTTEETATSRRPRPKVVQARRSDAKNARGSFFTGRFSSQQQEEELLEGSERDLEPFMVGKQKLSIWPYDDYHLVQKLYYENMEEKETVEDDKDEPKPVVDSGLPIFSRPPDPPDVTEACQGLPLTEFERVSEERSIAIVSTWLFDAGLIDEFLVNGGMPNLTSNVSVDDSVPSQQGVEVPVTGVPIEGVSKMDKEIAKLRNATKRQLALINARLNDGVAATGAEVSELVQAVTMTKDDIGRLRELSTYVSNEDDLQQANQFMLTKYPKLQQTVNARRNLARCFRELDFFHQIPGTCDRLREELHAGEWTAHEWSSLRSVCREHVELEIFLVEAEAGMKQQDSYRPRYARNAAMRGRQKEELVDKFLKEHVDNVWELGDEIRLRIMSGIATSFELAMNNPSGMVALVEAIEVYESANEEYKSVHGSEQAESQTLRFTDMRAAALGELYKDLETRSLNVFTELAMQAADVAEEEEGANQQFSSVLRSANELTSEISLVRDQMAPCFPPNWRIETIWTTCVAHVCSNNILQQIGGPEGHKLPDLTVTQLLDLVAWVETFRDVIEESFPDLGVGSSVGRTYDLSEPPKLLREDKKTIDVEVAKDSLAWVNNTLWDVHDLAKDEFLYRTKEQTEEWLDNVYSAEHEKSQTNEGFLVTSLCEDVYSVAGVQLRTIRERLTRRSEALVQAVGVILKNLYEKQMACRDDFCTDLETCCAASNDFIRMSERAEELIEEIKDEANLSVVAAATLEEQAAALLGLYSGDAVYAAQKTHVYCFEPIKEEVADELFGQEWLSELTQNELALTIARTLDDFAEDIETFVDEHMVQKAIEAQIKSSCIFYLRCLLKRSSSHSGRHSFFDNDEKAIQRMRGDVLTIRDYFDGLAETFPTISRVIESEFDLLDTMVEILCIAAGLSRKDVSDFIVTLQRRVKNIDVTKYVVGDLFHLIDPAREKEIYDLVDSMEVELNAVAAAEGAAATNVADRMAVPGLRVDEMLANHCDECDRRRPVQKGAMEKAEEAFSKWRKKAQQPKEQE